MKSLDKSHTTNFTKHILEAQGEGSIVRRPESHYHQGRSDELIKLKVCWPDPSSLLVLLSNMIPPRY